MSVRKVLYLYKYFYASLIDDLRVNNAKI